MPNIGLGNIARIRLAEQGADVAAPAATFSILYLLASGVLRVRNAAATVYQYVTTAHDHSGTTNGPKLTQANSHESPDTDSAPTSLHHTTGTGTNQAAAGDHAHAAPDASVVTYTPAVLTDWDTDADPGDADNALDQLAERVDDLEGASIDASVVTYTPAVATDWDGDADPGDADNALDQLAERVDDLEGASPGSHTILSVTHSDTNVAAPNDGDVLTWDATPGEWKAAPSAGGGGTSILEVQVFS